MPSAERNSTSVNGLTFSFDHYYYYDSLALPHSFSQVKATNQQKQGEEKARQLQFPWGSPWT
jgi:hypothetical protein